MLTSPLTLPGLLADALATGAVDPFLLTDCGGWLSFADVALAAGRFAAALRERGIERGERVAILMDNRPECVAALLGTAWANGAYVPINPGLTDDDVRAVVDHAGVRFMATEARHLPRVARSCGLKALALVTVAPPRAADGPLAAGLAGTVAWDDLDGAPLELAAAAARPEDLALIQYTSGTTASPKGVMLSHGALRTAFAARARHLGYGVDDTLLALTPLFHLNAQAMVLMGLGAHCRVVLRERFSASAFWPDVRRHRVTSVNGLQAIPRILLARERDPEERAHPLRTMVAVLPPELHRRFEERFAVALVPVYGLTEDPMPVLGPATGFPAGEDARLASCGRPVDPEVHRIRIVGEDGRDLPAGAVGEIVKRSPATMLGYHQDPAATAAVLRDGWLATGDLGYLDDDGFLYFVGRKKDVVRRSGEMIAAAEVESALASHPAVGEVAVVGVPDEFRGEELLACLVLSPGSEWGPVLAADVLAHCARTLAPFKVPRFLQVRDELPKTATLKIRKQPLRDAGVLAGAYDRERPSGAAPGHPPAEAE